MNTRYIFSGVATSLLSLVIALFIGEIAIRAFWVPPSLLSTQQTEEHPIYGWAPIPGISGRVVNMEFEYNFSHTAQGFRGSHLFTAKRPDGISYRILFLGDSFTYGQGSEDSEIFVEIIRANIENSEIINSGTNGYGHRQELAVLDTLGEVVEPDLVI